MDPETSEKRELPIAHLFTDPFDNLMTLKMLSLFPDSCTTTLYTDASGWACRTQLDSKVSGWDREEYPDADVIVMLDGNSPSLLQYALKHSRFDAVVFKLHDRWSRATLSEDHRFVLANSFISYSHPGQASVMAPTDTALVQQHSNFDDEVSALLATSGYAEQEFLLHLDRGAQWFAIRDEQRIVSMCIAYQNHGDIWEIGGVVTLPEYRRQGFARSVVSAALNHLYKLKLVLRYQFHHHNIASRHLAVSLGLKPRLTVDHYVDKIQEFGSAATESA
jgi:ribosomal protein S18 acetylase RimI-like enzyme